MDRGFAAQSNYDMGLDELACLNSSVEHSHLDRGYIEHSFSDRNFGGCSYLDMNPVVHSCFVQKKP